MEAFGVLLALAVIAVVVVLPIWLIFAVLNLRSRAETDRQQSNRYRQDLTTRVHLLETHLKELKQDRSAFPQQAEESQPKPAEPSPVQAAIASERLTPQPAPVPHVSPPAARHPQVTQPAPPSPASPERRVAEPVRREQLPAQRTEASRPTMSWRPITRSSTRARRAKG